MRKDTSSGYNLFTLSAACKAFFIISLALMNITARAQNMDLTVVGNPTGVPSEMKLSELKSLMMGEKQRWQNGKRIIIALMKTNTDVGKTTSAKVYDMSGDQLNKFWLALVFQGKASAPAFFNTESDLENFVASNPGAIGIVDKAIPGPDVRAIIIDGQKTF